MMKFEVWQVARRLAILALISILGVSAGLLAQTHVVSSAELQKQAVAASRARQQNLETIGKFLSSPEAEKVLGAAGVDSARLKASLATLDDQELARLAERSAKAQADFAAGRLTDRDLLLILLGFVALILIIVAVR